MSGECGWGEEDGWGCWGGVGVGGVELGMGSIAVSE